MSTDDYGTEYIYPPAKWGESLSIQHERISAQDERFSSVNEAIGLLQYGQQQTDDLADQRHNDHERRIHSATEQLRGLEIRHADDHRRIEWLENVVHRLLNTEAAQPIPQISRWPAAAHPPEGDWAHIPSAEWEAICEELEGLRAKWASVPWEALRDCVSGAESVYAASGQSELVAWQWFEANAPKETGE